MQFDKWDEENQGLACGFVSVCKQYSAIYCCSIITVRKKTAVFLCVVSVAFTTLLVGAKGDVWEEKLRAFYYHTILLKRVPATYYVQTDSVGVPVVEYVDLSGETITQLYLPTTVAIYALKYFDEWKEHRSKTAAAKLFHCLNSLRDSITYRDNYALYEFHFQQTYYASVGVPWSSGLSSGKAIEAFVRGYEWSGDGHYLIDAEKLMRGFYADISEGGFTYKASNGWWYEEYADTSLNTPRVVNGHIDAVLGVYEFVKLTGSDSARQVFENGLQALRSNIHRYDADNGWTYYDANGKKSDKQYQRTMVDMVRRLYAATGDTLFLQYQLKWQEPFNRHYIWRMTEERNKSGALLCLLVFSSVYGSLLFMVKFLII